MSSMILQPASEQTDATRPKALIVNCNAEISQFFQTAFQSVSWQITVLDDYTTITSHCSAERPNVIVLAGADGCAEALDVIAEIRSHEAGHEIPIISAMATAQNEDRRQELLDAGSDLVDAQPGRKADVLAQVARAANHRLQSNGRFPTPRTKGAWKTDINKKHPLS